MDHLPEASRVVSDLLPQDDPSAVWMNIFLGCLEEGGAGAGGGRGGLGRYTFFHHLRGYYRTAIFYTRRVTTHDKYPFLYLCFFSASGLLRDASNQMEEGQTDTHTDRQHIYT